MAVTRCSLISAGRSGNFTADFNRTYLVVFQVIVDDPYDGALAVANAVDPVTGVGIPKRYQEYAGYERNFSDVTALCMNAVPDQAGDEWQRWLVKCTFDGSYQIQKQENPADDTVLPWIEIETERRKIVNNWAGAHITNSAGQFFGNLTLDFDSITYCFLRNEPEITPFLFSYARSTNSDSILGAAPGTLRLKIHVDKPLRRNEYVYFPHTYRFKYDPDGWNKDIVDRGTAVKLSDGTLGRPRNPNNPEEVIDGEVNLDGSGNLLPAGSSPVFLSSSKFMNGLWVGSAPQILQTLPYQIFGLTS